MKDYRRKEPVCSGVPSIMYIESTNRCNLNCIMCPRRLMTRDQMDMDLNLFETVLNQLNRNLTELIVLHSDGEPLINPDIIGMIRIAKKNGYQVMTSTNATMLDDRLSREIVDAGLDILTISIDGTSREIYEKIRRGANFKQVVTNIKRFLTLKGIRTPYTILQMIIMKENEAQIDEFFEMWRPYRNRNVQIVVKPVTDWFGEHSEIIDDMNSCDRPWFGMVIQSSGKVVPCVHDFDGDMVLGELPRDQIYDLWNSESMVNLRKGIIRGRRENNLCSRCNATPPRRFTLFSTLGLSILDMGSIAKTLAAMGYKRPKQY